MSCSGLLWCGNMKPGNRFRLIVLAIVGLISSASAQEAQRSIASHGTPLAEGRVIELNDGIRDVENFTLEAGDTLVVRESAAIVAERAIVLRGKVIVELPDDAPQGALAPRLELRAGRAIVLLGEMAFGDGRPGVDVGVMGGTGASLTLRAPIIGIGMTELVMGDGGDSGPNVEGGGGGICMALGWVVAFHEKGLTVRGGDGGDGGNGLPGSDVHPRGHRGGDGGSGGGAFGGFHPLLGAGDRPFEEICAQALGVAPEMDRFVGPDRRDSSDSTWIGGDGGDGGNGGLPDRQEELQSGGGNGGAGGTGGFAGGAWGIPGAPPKFDANGTPYRYAKSMHGARGGAAIGGNGGAGGDAGEGQSNFVRLAGGNGGDGGDAIGGLGGRAPSVPPGTPALWVGGDGPGGIARGGNGGNGGFPSGDGGDAGQATPGQDGSWRAPIHDEPKKLD